MTAPALSARATRRSHRANRTLPSTMPTSSMIGRYITLPKFAAASIAFPPVSETAFVASATAFTVFSSIRSAVQFAVYQRLEAKLSLAERVPPALTSASHCHLDKIICLAQACPRLNRQGPPRGMVRAILACATSTRYYRRGGKLLA